MCVVLYVCDWEIAKRVIVNYLLILYPKNSVTISVDPFRVITLRLAVDVAMTFWFFWISRRLPYHVCNYWWERRVRCMLCRPHRPSLSAAASSSSSTTIIYTFAARGILLHRRRNIYDDDDADDDGGVCVCDYWYYIYIFSILHSYKIRVFRNPLWAPRLELAILVERFQC